MARQPMPIHSIPAIIDWRDAGEARIPGYKTEIGDKLAAILAELGFKDEVKVQETLVNSAAVGFPTLTETVGFETAEQRDAAVAKLRPLFLALNPVHMAFGTVDKGPMNNDTPRHTFNLVAHDWAHAYPHVLYEDMLDTVTALEAGLKAPKPGPG